MYLRMQVPRGSIKVRKGAHSEVESYSGFYDVGKRADTGLAAALKGKGVTDVFVCGLATDVCVGK